MKAFAFLWALLALASHPTSGVAKPQPATSSHQHWACGKSVFKPDGTDWATRCSNWYEGARISCSVVANTTSKQEWLAYVHVVADTRYWGKSPQGWVEVTLYKDGKLTASAREWPDDSPDDTRKAAFVRQWFAAHCFEGDLRGPHLDALRKVRAALDAH